jgi:hypothetical protein
LSTIAESRFIVALACAATLLTGLATDTSAATAEQACRTMTEKLSVSAEIANWNSIEEKWTFREGRLRSAELVVMGAYATNKRSLDKEWPGFFDWSVAAVLKAWRANLTPEEFTAVAYADCFSTYSK